MASTALNPLPARTEAGKLHPPPPPSPPLRNPNALLASCVVAHRGAARRLLFRAARPLPCYRIHLSLSQTQQQMPSSSSSPDSFSPPVTREDAILQAKTCLSTTVQKPLNNAVLLPTKKVKKQKQPRFRVEIPVVDDSPSSLAQLASDVFSDLPIRRKGARPTILLLWPDSALAKLARQAFADSAVVNAELGEVDPRLLSSADLGVFMASNTPQLDQMMRVCDDFYPKPLILFNPRWAFEEEKGFDGALEAFAGSFEVLYSFTGLEVKGLLSRRKGAVFRWVKEGVFSGEGWMVLVEDDAKNGELKVVTRFRKRPSIGEVENVLYNLMAANSPVTKSVKFVKDLVSNVTGRKQN